MASKRQLRKRACGKKAAYDNEAQAAAVRKDRIEQGQDVYNVYKCPTCGKFHLGHKPNHAASTQTTRRIRRADARWIKAEREMFRAPMDQRPASVKVFNPPHIREVN